MTDKLRIALAQLNPTVGAFDHNLDLARRALADAVHEKADILLFSELFMTGYFPEDLLLKPQFVKDAMQRVRTLAAETKGLPISVLMTSVWILDGERINAVLLLEDGNILDIRAKVILPNDDVFYEKRYFKSGDLPDPIEICGVKIGVPICEDAWHKPVCKALAERGAELLLCPNGSPYWRNKHAERVSLIGERVKETGLPFIYLNQVGGQDELLFDGGTFGLSRKGELVLECKAFETSLHFSDWERQNGHWECVAGERSQPIQCVEDADWRACVLGLRDYLRKNGFKSVVLGLSGGIDSAVVAAMACDAIGADNVHCIMMPYRYTSQASIADAKDCAERLGVRYDVVSIGDPVDAAVTNLAPIFGDRAPDLAEENIQSRMRGLILMAVSNKLGAMLLSTGNKSEMAVGYATIYGDMNGGFNPLKDVVKTRVYKMAEWRNTHMPEDCLGPKGEIIPPAIIEKAPSAELREDQKDQDSLPPYDVLDAILEGFVEQELSVAEIVAKGFDLETVKRMEKLLYIAEYKRRQAPPGVKITRRAFGVGRKYPITTGYRDNSSS